MESPYNGVRPNSWPQITRQLIEEHPLPASEIVDVVLGTWDSIFASTIGSKHFRIGVQIFPKPQIMGFFLHELIPLEFSARYPDVWRTEVSKEDKDIVYVPDERYSIELKTSSSAGRIFGNRSYAQPGTKGRKAKFGYYLAVNFQKFIDKNTHPVIKLIRFGWIDATDWIAQKAPSGQQSRLPPSVEKFKLLQLYPTASE